MSTVNVTSARVAALRLVAKKRITYDATTGSFFDGGERIGGARRRTFAELVRAELAKTAATEGGGPVEVVLTEAGVDILR